MSGPRVVFGGKTVAIPATGLRQSKPVIPPVPDEDGTIFVSIASYRDGERCGDTIQSIFENAKDPDKVIIGVAEQNAAEDAFCVEEYCKRYGLQIIDRGLIRKDMTKVVTLPDALAKCPRSEQIRQISFHHIEAKGPAFTRSLLHKVLGNEEFCLQMDAHTKLAPQWDAHMKEEWKMIGNEFAVLSTVPPSVENMDELLPTSPKATEVPRQCMVKFRSNGVPDFDSLVEDPASKAIDLERPLLSHGWSAAYSFSKCHLEESVPYDPFSHYAMPVEQFVRYARMWTRGYDTYTPTRNYLFHDYNEQPNGHGNNEWFQRQKQRFRLMALRRAKKILGLLEEELPESNYANLGLYGLGKRRSLADLQGFSNLDFHSKRGNEGIDAICVHDNYVLYDKSVSPVANLYDEPVNLDPQPEYPLRINLKFAHQPKYKSSNLADIDLNLPGSHAATSVHHEITHPSPLSNLPPVSLLLLLWIFGLVVWGLLFLHNPPAGDGFMTSTTTKMKRVKKRVYKDV